MKMLTTSLSCLLLAALLAGCQLTLRYTLILESQKLTLVQGSTAMPKVTYDYQSGIGFQGPNSTTVSLRIRHEESQQNL
jgi:hypothetical protein